MLLYIGVVAWATFAQALSKPEVEATSSSRHLLVVGEVSAYFFKSYKSLCFDYELSNDLKMGPVRMSSLVGDPPRNSNREERKLMRSECSVF